MLSPKRVKFRKMFKGRTRGVAVRGSTIAFGSYGLQAMEPGWIGFSPNKPITKKPAETRMGKGKGSPEGWVAVVKPGRVMFELEGIPKHLAEKAMGLAAAKMPIKTKFVVREGARTDAGATAEEGV